MLAGARAGECCDAVPQLQQALVDADALGEALPCEELMMQQGEWLQRVSVRGLNCCLNEGFVLAGPAGRPHMGSRALAACSGT